MVTRITTLDPHDTVRQNFYLVFRKLSTVAGLPAAKRQGLPIVKTSEDLLQAVLLPELARKDVVAPEVAVKEAVRDSEIVLAMHAAAASMTAPSGWQQTAGMRILTQERNGRFETMGLRDSGILERPQTQEWIKIVRHNLSKRLASVLAKT